jgi:hypothetical protein
MSAGMIQPGGGGADQQRRLAQLAEAARAARGIENAAAE